MQALNSVPLVPQASICKCCATKLCGCFIGQVFKACGKIAKNPVVARMIYAGQLLFVAGMAWLISNLPYWSTGQRAWLKKLPGLRQCDEQASTECYGAMGVYRFMSAICVYHLFFMLTLIKTKTIDDCRHSMQHSWWTLKAAFLIGLIVAAFFIPNSFYHIFGYIALGGSFIFILVRLLLLIDFAQRWNDSWVRRYEKNKCYGALLLGTTGILYAIVVGLSVVLLTLFTNFGVSQCTLNTVTPFVNLGLIVLFSILSISSCVRKAAPHAGLLQSAVVALYATYLVWSAINSEPNATRDVCGSMTTPSISGPHFFAAGSQISLIIGVAFTMLAIAYGAFRAGSSSEKLKEEVQGSLLMDDELATIAEGNMPPATNIQEVLANQRKVKYNYAFFHLIFATASMYLAMILTNWQIIKPSNADHSVYDVDKGNVVSVWVKLVSSWVTVGIYLWTLVAPLFCPNRQFN
mmetsp:Transcript_24100/g.26755  ORF Transcript_24100/g.26755 Transcript_24100/m.26755 type:complete len:463 (+) Transcript_24100:49-1437(+)